MNSIVVDPQPSTFIDGDGLEVIGFNLSIQLDDPSLFDPTGDLLLQVTLEVSVPPKTIQIAQRRPYSAIIFGTPSLLPLAGTLWLLGSPGSIHLLDSSVTIYYTMAS